MSEKILEVHRQCTNFLSQLWRLKGKVLQKEIMQESVIYQDIVQKEALEWARLFINRRFGEINSSWMERINK